MPILVLARVLVKLRPPMTGLLEREDMLIRILLGLLRI